MKGERKSVVVVDKEKREGMDASRSSLGGIEVGRAWGSPPPRPRRARRRRRGHRG